VTLFFSDVAGFVTLSSQMDEARVSDLLNRLYTRFDDLAHYHGVYKLETIGDAYLAATNITGDQVKPSFKLCNKTSFIVVHCNHHQSQPESRCS
jgi:hypothetical protein